MTKELADEFYDNPEFCMGPTSVSNDEWYLINLGGINRYVRATGEADLKLLKQFMLDSHPDRGGDHNAFIRASEAYNRIKARLDKRKKPSK